MAYDLNDYTHIDSNQILKIKLANKAGFVYGEMKSVLAAGLGTAATVGSFQQFLNYEECLANASAVPAFTRRPIASSDVESVEIMIDAVFG